MYPCGRVCEQAWSLSSLPAPGAEPPAADLRHHITPGWARAGLERATFSNAMGRVVDSVVDEVRISAGFVQGRLVLAHPGTRSRGAAYVQTGQHAAM